MSVLSNYKATLQTGALVEVTNHYITREDHPAFGTTVRRVTKVNSASVYLEYVEGPCSGKTPGPMSWPKASEIGVTSGGVFNIDYPGKPGVQFLSVKLRENQ